jgi:hypothetical protein
VKRLAVAVLLLLTLVGCTALRSHIARGGQTLIERSDTAALIYLADGVAFDSGREVALGTRLTLDGDDMVLSHVPASVTCEFTHVDQVACDLGDVNGVVVIRLTGVDVIGAADFRRPGSNFVHLVFLR